MRSDGREFHEEGPETVNARGPSVEVRHRGMQSSPTAADRSFDRPDCDRDVVYDEVTWSEIIS